jgi:hypothetical protein
MMTWLLSIGISPSKVDNYTRMFMSEEVNSRALEGMTMEQLEAMGVHAMGPRALIFNAAQSGMCIYNIVCSSEITGEQSLVALHCSV